jgi:hypothetical protein
MKKSLDRRSFAGLLGALALAACTPDAAPSVAPMAPAGLHSYRYDGVAGSSQVTQERADSGRESLRGTTELALQGLGLGGESAPRTLTRETVALDAQGRLEHAEIVVSRSGGPEARYTLDASRGAVHVERAGSAPLDWQVPVDAPWLYSPGSAPEREEGDLVVTPVGAWVALRAASAGNVVRVLEPEHQRSYLVMADQVAVPTERGTTVALGYDGVDADGRFITELRLSHGSVTLARVAAVDLGV